MPIKHSSQAKNTSFQRNQAVLTTTARAPLDHKPSVNQLSSNLDRGPPMKGAAPSRRGGMKSRRLRSFSGFLNGYPGNSQGPRIRLGEAKEEEGEESEDNQVEASLESATEASEAPNTSLSNQPLVSQADGEDDSIHGKTHSSSFPQEQFKNPIIQDSFNEGT
ncbi:hypothetical protein O181_047796 [Austropuccinia psidii MF-1]|uniref:Uncharacterized protein n=1 Tax=Austropuccinia psidii MF-1 TaxID=1389203 RepID=A0A9Q3DPF9_9BASI|nr:hypothetical protein [Austropuccinia psidii MF-1]